jgi:glycosyltransferase involved in cell wall biosynthesis
MSGQARLKVSLLTGGKDPHYALGLLSGLITKEIDVDFVANDLMKDAEVVKDECVAYYNLRGNQAPDVSFKEKAARVIRYYLKLIAYAAKTDSKIFHILWLNKFTYFDRILLNVYYRLLGKKLIFTAHNVNIEERDARDSFLNRLSLRFMYALASHIFVHTERMKRQLMENFSVGAAKISVIPFGINNIIPRSSLTREEARRRLRLDDDEKTILFFGNIAPYKGLDILIQALTRLKQEGSGPRLLIAGRIKNCQPYWDDILSMIDKYGLKDKIVTKIQYIPDDEVELYYKSADLLILPYRYIFQSGVIFLSYSFGLPVVATDVGTLAEEVLEGETGFMCRPEDPDNLASKIDLYFKSDLYKNLEANREKIIRYANEKYSWENIGELTYEVYKGLLSGCEDRTQDLLGRRSNGDA